MKKSQASDEYNYNNNNMKTLLLSLASIVAFASTWFVIKKQVHSSGVLWPLSFRFFLGSIFLFFYAKYRRTDLKLSFYQHKAVWVQAVLLFSFNFVAIYAASKYLYSGVNALIGATVVVFNVINSALFYRKKTNRLLLFSSFLGLLGLFLVLWFDFYHIFQQKMNFNEFLLGVFLGLLGSYITSCGQVFTLKLLQLEVSILQMNIFGMFYGALLIASTALVFEGISFGSYSLEYLLSIFYIALIPTAFGFVFYTNLVKNIGAERSGYIFVFVPLVAIVVSSFYEGYQWQSWSCLGVFFVVLGKLLPFIKDNLLSQKNKISL